MGPDTSIEIVVICPKTDKSNRFLMRVILFLHIFKILNYDIKNNLKISIFLMGYHLFLFLNLRHLDLNIFLFNVWERLGTLGTSGNVRERFERSRGGTFEQQVLYISAFTPIFF